MEPKGETIDWSRCIIVDGVIDEALLTRLTPQILALRQQSADPITVAINSGGGSVAVMDALRGLLGGADQDGNTCDVITVVTHRAFSAAAQLLTLGDYSVALNHTRILYHDVRYSGLDDVTPRIALDAAKQLRFRNESAALRLANRMFPRWTWNYLDVVKDFADDASGFPQKSREYKGAVDACNLPVSPAFRFDLAGFALSIFVRLSSDNEALMDEAVKRLHHWATVVELSRAIPRYQSAQGTPGMLDGAKVLYDLLNASPSAEPFGGAAREADANLLLTLALSRLATAPRGDSTDSFENAVNDFALLKTMDDQRHNTTATRLMLRHKHIFFEPATAANWEHLDQPTRDEISLASALNVRAAWLLCLLVARELFNGEHSLSPDEALCLGLVDEVPGSDKFVSRREVYKDMAKRSAADQPPRQLRKISRRRGA